MQSSALSLLPKDVQSLILDQESNPADRAYACLTNPLLYQLQEELESESGYWTDKFEKDFGLSVPEQLTTNPMKLSKLYHLLSHANTLMTWRNQINKRGDSNSGFQKLSSEDILSIYELFDILLYNPRLLRKVGIGKKIVEENSEEESSSSSGSEDFEFELNIRALFDYLVEAYLKFTKHSPSRLSLILLLKEKIENALGDNIESYNKITNGLTNTVGKMVGDNLMKYVYGDISFSDFQDFVETIQNDFPNAIESAMKHFTWDALINDDNEIDQVESEMKRLVRALRKYKGLAKRIEWSGAILLCFKIFLPKYYKKKLASDERLIDHNRHRSVSKNIKKFANETLEEPLNDILDLFLWLEFANKDSKLSTTSKFDSKLKTFLVESSGLSLGSFFDEFYKTKGNPKELVRLINKHKAIKDELLRAYSLLGARQRQDVFNHFAALLIEDPTDEYEIQQLKNANPNISERQLNLALKKLQDK